MAQAPNQLGKILCLHLIRHFVTPSPSGEGEYIRYQMRTYISSAILCVRARVVETSTPTEKAKQRWIPRICGEFGGSRLPPLQRIFVTLCKQRGFPQHSTFVCGSSRRRPLRKRRNKDGFRGFAGNLAGADCLPYNGYLLHCVNKEVFHNILRSFAGRRDVDPYICQ